MRVSSVSAVSPTTTGAPVDERAAQDRDRIREQQVREAEERRVQPAPRSNAGSTIDRRV